MTLTAKGTSTTVFLKATGPSTYLLQRSDGSLAGADRPGPAAEWRITRTPRGLLVVRSVSSGTPLSGSGVFRARRAGGCRRHPEAQLGARGTPATGTLSGWADVHLHITADGRAGGLVISGKPFHRFGSTEALGHDADVHGPDGSLDIAGNLLRSGAAELPARLLSFAEDQVRGPVGVAMGSDTGGFADLPGPGTGRTPLRYPFRSFDGRVQFSRQQTGSRTFDLNTDGVAHHGLMPDLLALVGEQPRGQEALAVLFRSTAAYLQTWRRTGAR